MWYVIISWSTTIISTTQILYYKYFPSPLAPVLLIEDHVQQQREQEQEQQREQQREQEGEKENRVEMQNIKNSREKKHDYKEYEYQHSMFTFY